MGSWRPAKLNEREPETGLWNFVLYTWECEWSKTPLIPVGAGSVVHKLLPGREFLLFSIGKCQFLTMEMLCRAVLPLWFCERSQAAFLPNFLAPHSPSWHDALTLHPILLHSQAPADLWRQHNHVVFYSLIRLLAQASEQLFFLIVKFLEENLPLIKFLPVCTGWGRCWISASWFPTWKLVCFQANGI